MPTPIVVRIGALELHGSFNDSLAGQAAARALPFEWQGSRWGDEYYGPPSADLGDPAGKAGSVMNVGDLGWYAPNQWFCLFFGPTPASSGQQPAAAVPLLTVGNVQGDWGALRKMGGSISARVEKSSLP
jgi:hypothetical protein